MGIVRPGEYEAVQLLRDARKRERPLPACGAVRRRLVWRECGALTWTDEGAGHSNAERTPVRGDPLMAGSPAS
jgi:hypothetical protein